MSETEQSLLKDMLHPIRKYTIGDGDQSLVVDLENSHGIWMKDKFSDKSYLDFFTFYASAPIGYNHPSMIEDHDFIKDLKLTAVNKISNSDYYTPQLAKFVQTFGEKVAPKGFEHLFFISGGALAVENTLKAAFDWKVKTNILQGKSDKLGSQILHFKEAFHGRSGYTLSLTNTADPRKYKHFPVFNWPRVSNPKITFPLEDNLNEVIKSEESSLEEINNAFDSNNDDIAAIIIEPIQGEGGDNHFRGEFLQQLRNIADEREAMLIFDEVQTGIGLTGKMWALEHFKGAEPDLVAFGKKTQVCGMMSNKRIDSVDDNVFRESSRINSTWGGNIVDMVRSTKIIEIIEQDNLVENAEKQGSYLFKVLQELQDKNYNISNIRHRGLFAAFDVNSTVERDQLLKNLKTNGLILLKSGIKSIRFRPPLIVQEEDIDQMFAILENTLKNQN